jgi:hypothetical protein
MMIVSVEQRPGWTEHVITLGWNAVPYF